MTRIAPYHDLFAFMAATPSLIVVTTNLALRANGKGVMGAGVARSARDHFAAQGKDLEAEYGRFLQDALDRGETLEGRAWLSRISPVIYLPTKRHFRDPSPLDLIEANLKALNHMCRNAVLPVGVPLVGAENGGLHPDVSETLLHRHLTASAFQIVKRAQPAPRERFPAELLSKVRGKRVLFITGHRPDKLGGYAPDVRAYTRDMLTKVAEHYAPDLIVSGMAQGIDMGLAEAAEMLGIPLIAAAPCRGQESPWPQKARETYTRLMEYAGRTGGVYYVHDGPYNGPQCMVIRDQWMVDLIAHCGPDSGMTTVWNKDPEGGTATTLKMLKKSGHRFLGNYWSRFVAGHPSAAFRTKYQQPDTGGLAAGPKAA